MDMRLAVDGERATRWAAMQRPLLFSGAMMGLHQRSRSNMPRAESGPNRRTPRDRSHKEDQIGVDNLITSSVGYHAHRLKLLILSDLRQAGVGRDSKNAVLDACQRLEASPDAQAIRWLDAALADAGLHETAASRKILAQFEAMVEESEKEMTQNSSRRGLQPGRD